MPMAMTEIIKPRKILEQTRERSVKENQYDLNHWAPYVRHLVLRKYFKNN
jgi:hypothetical protein